ncbi:MAG: uncharacterized protein K0S09_2528 [Sphingobacteriaceae bacterium]|jgi:hypothetical protein|nr:uncharacterized protein [Sphingobacteriaceae bacterium]
MLDYKTSPGTAGNSDIPDRYDDLPSHNIEVFQSENIQNILDAKSHTKECIEITYEIKKLTPDDKVKLEGLLGPKFFNVLKKSFEKSESQDIEEQVEKVKLALANPDKWFSLTIKEKNTIGLIGDETGASKGSKYHALMRHINKSEKDDISGGTFGKGSSVYTYCSGLWLWFAYSVLETPWQGTNVRFVGRGMIAPFIDRDENRSYGGPLWYAKPESPSEYVANNPQQGLPFTNEDAHREARKFNIPLRDDSEFGTTTFIPVFWPEDISLEDMDAEKLANELRLQIVKRWFIPIYNGILRCSIKILDSDVDDVVINKSELYNIPELKHKLEIIEWYDKPDDNDKRFKIKHIRIELPVLTQAQIKRAEHQYKTKIGSKKSFALVDLVIRVLNDEEKHFRGFEDDSVGTVNRVALVRNKGMIVNHFPYHSSSKASLKALAGDNDFEGILFAGRMVRQTQPEEIINHTELFLGYSENPAHNEWIHDKVDKNRCHLKRFEETSYPFNKVKGLFTQITLAISDFFPKDDKPPEKNEICTFWRKLYKLPSIGGEKGGESNFSYQTVDEGFDQEGRYFWKLKVKSNRQDGKVKLDFKHYLSSLEGPITSPEEYTQLGVPEFVELTVYEDQTTQTSIVLEYDAATDIAISKEITVKTCRLTSNPLFKNLSPLLEINDSIIN